MATRARNAQPSDWKAAFRRSLARVCQRSFSVLLFALMVFLTLALVSYSQTDPSPSTAAGEVIANWMGRSGAWAAERALWSFGLVSVLFLPLLYAFARKLWRTADESEEDDNPDIRMAEGRWWQTTLVLLVAMALLSVVLALVSNPAAWAQPAGPGGIVGLLGEGALRALAGRLPEAGQFWAMLVGGIAALLGGAFLAG